MEQYELLFNEYDISISPKQMDLFNLYVKILMESNRVQNLTGFSTADDIFRHLIIDSIIPLYARNVPRGTCFVDIGTGQGIPGIVISILFPGKEGVLIDSNSRKTEFVKHAVEQLKLKNITVICARVEESSRSADYRERFDACFSRAFSPLYSAIEFSSPFVKTGGAVFVYTSEEENKLNKQILKQASRMGLSLVISGKHKQYCNAGLLFEKIAPINDMYPRRNAIIKRESSRCT